MNSSRRLVGRSAELARFDVLLDRISAGGGGGLLLVGPPGVGKTRLLAEAAEAAQGGGVTVARSASLPLTASLPYDAVLELLRVLGEPVWSPSVPGPHELFGEVLARLEARASREPLLLCVDDLQWSDAGTLELVHFCLARLLDLPIGWVLASRPATDAGLLAHRLERAELVERIAVLPLTLAETGQLAEDLLGPDGSSEQLVEVLFERTGGNPLLCEQLLAAFEAGVERTKDVRAVAEHVPDGVIHAVAERSDRLAPELREALRWAAVLPVPFTFADLRRVAGPGAASAPEQLADAGFLRSDGHAGWSFVHSIVRDAVYGALPVAERIRRHGLVADALSDGPTERRAPQLAKARRWSEAASAHLELARAALNRGQGEDATGTYERALALAKQAGDQLLQRDALAGRVLGLLRAGRADTARSEANELRGLLRDAGDDRERLSFLASYAAALANDVLDRRSAQEVLREAEPLLVRADEHLLAETLTVRAMVLWKTGEPETVLDDAKRAAALVRGTGDVALEVRAQHALGLAVGVARGAIEGVAILEKAVERADAVGLPVEQARLRMNLSYLAELAGDVVGGEAHTRRGLDVEGAPVSVTALLQHNLGSARHDAGDLDGALTHMLAAQRLSRRAGPQTMGTVALALAFEHIWRGELLAARRLLESYDNAGAEDPNAAITWGELLEAEGSPAEALASFQRSASHEDSYSVWGLGGVARTAIATGDLGAAAAATARLGELAERWPFATWHHLAAQALLAKAEGRTHDAIEDFLAAARACQEAPAAARLRFEAAHLARDRDQIVAAIGAFERMGARREADRARALARGLGMRPGRRRGRAGPLTGREQEVAQLIAGGHTNSEIAAALFISPRTVERHVGNILGKLGYRSRVQIAIDAGAGLLPSTARR